MGKPPSRRPPVQIELPMDTGQRIEPELADEAVPVTTEPDLLDRLAQDIFRETGLKVSRNDPVIGAALLQSRLMDDAATRAADRLALRADEVAAKLTESVRASATHLDQADRAMAQAFAQLAEGTRTVTEQELLAVRASFARSAAETLDHVRRNVLRRSGWRYWWRDPAACLVGTAFGIAIGCGMTLYWTRGPSAEQTRLMQNGLLLDAAWPRLGERERRLLGPLDRDPPAASTPAPPRPHDRTAGRAERQ
ncbi:hypothetical protein IP91_00330 [Pseudoduganella lurida]|uniref:Uncharacterized protein n=1 Tax=Pseudoduganella lurida TaxID=1036180 RepID=A0A562RK11_9BURK|nr:hypothetical protein [Pseudoduganella lurida]TWI69263.1 hypothetical protein IP91_00330 [Pseudoduganella lurida]